MTVHLLCLRAYHGAALGLLLLWLGVVPGVMAQTNGWPAGIPVQAYPGAVLQGNLQYMGLERNEPWRFRPIEESDIKIIQDDKVIQVEDMQVEGTLIKLKPKYRGK